MSTRDKLLRIFFCLDVCFGDTELVASAGDTGRMRFVLLAELDDREESLVELLSPDSNANSDCGNERVNSELNVL